MMDLCLSSLGQVCQVEYALAFLSSLAALINLFILIYLLFFWRKINNYLRSEQESNPNQLNQNSKIYYVSSTKWHSSFTKLLFILGLLLELAAIWLEEFSSKLPNIILVVTSFLFILSTMWKSFIIQSRVKLKKISSLLFWLTSIIWLLISAAHGWRLGYILPTASWNQIKTTSSLLIAFSSLIITILEARQAIFWSKEQEKIFIFRGAYTHHLSSVPSKILFWWMLPLFRTSLKKDLTFEDLGELPEKESSQIHYQNFNLIYNQYSNHWGGLWTCYWRFCRRDWMFGGFLKFLGDLATMMGPIGLAVVVEYTSQLTKERTKPNSTVDLKEIGSWSVFFSDAHTMATLSFLIALAQGSLSQASTHLINVQAIRLKNALQSMIYVKSLRLPISQGNEDNIEMAKDPGFVTNLVSEDAFNIMSAFCVGHYLWAIPLKIFLLVYLLYRTIGVSGVLGALVCVAILAPFQYWLAKRMASNGRDLSSSTDDRIRLVHEGIKGARILKLHGWECWHHNRVSSARKKETNYLNKDSIYWAVSTLLVHGLTVLVTLTTFAFREYILPQNESIRASQLFAGLALFNQLAVPLFIIPAALPILVSAGCFLQMHDSWRYVKISTCEIWCENNTSLTIVGRYLIINRFIHAPLPNYIRFSYLLVFLFNSTRRLDTFLKLPEISSPTTTAASSFCSNAAFIISPKAKFGWGSDSITLSVPFPLRIPKGKLTVLVGSVGSGKTSLIAALLNEMITIEGQVLLQRGLNLAYSAQQVWLPSGSVRDIIINWNPSNDNASRYKKVISCCALEPDLAILPKGDAAKLGADEEAKNTESGIVLSGGQKQRVALARALYSQAQILLLDDPLSALDEQVAMHVFEQGIKRFAQREENRTIIMSSHRAFVLKEANQIIVMQDGLIHLIAKGGIQEIKEKDPKLYYSLLQSQEPMTQSNIPSVPREVYTRTARERWQLIRLVSKIGLQLKYHLISQETDEESNADNDLMTDGFRRRAGTGISDGIPRYLLVHELPPTQDWWCATISGSRRSTLTLRRDLNNHGTSSIWRSSTLQPRRQNHSSFSCIAPISKSKRVRRQHSTPAMLSQHHNYNLPTRSSLIRRLFISTPNETSFSRSSPNESVNSIIEQELFSQENILRNISNMKEGWLGYISICGWLPCLCYGLTTLIWQALRVFTDFWLTRWTDSAQQEHQDENLWFFERYAWLTLLSLFFSAGSHGFGFWSGARGRRHLHEKLSSTVLVNASPKWLTTTPFGKLADRFSTDMAIVDKKLCPAVQRLSQFGLLCASAIFVNICIAPWFLIAAVPISVAYYFIQRIYRTTSQQIQSLDALGRGPLLAHVSDTLLGRSTIRAFGQQHKYIREFIEKLDRHVVAYLILDASARWLGIALDYIGAFIVFLSSIATITAASSYPERVTPSLVGLAINYTLLVPVYLNWVVKFAADVDIYMSAADRIYSCIDSVEIEQHIGVDNGLKVEDTWPEKGEIHFDRVTLRYGRDLEPIIKNLTLHIPPGQKVGIVGRTGSGKSTLLMSLFGMVHIESPPDGGIRIDGVDIRKLTACILRSRISSIPQDSIIFSGSIRDNLDPKKKYSDQELWHSLEMVQLKDFVKSFTNGLDTLISPDTFGSAGEHQLLTVARAFLRGSKCVTLDEATAALDAVTERQLLQAIRHAFEGKTIVAVAHRISTLMECDRLLVLEAGQGIVEDGHPEELLACPTSRLHAFLDH